MLYAVYVTGWMTPTSQGGAIYASDAIVFTVNGSVFESNVAHNRTGGAISLEYDEQTPPNQTLLISWSRFVRNKAATQGGAIYASQTFANRPSNLIFSLSKNTDPNTKEWSWGGPCYAPHNTSTYRQWAYATHLLVDSSTLVQNYAGTADGEALASGAD